MEDIQEFFQDVTEEMVTEIMVGLTLDLEKIRDIGRLKSAAIHCVLNGPVGVNKDTNFPGVEGEFKVKDLYEGRLSNKMWRNFCRSVALALKAKFPLKCGECQQTSLFGDVWPLHTEVDN
jgi:hypothetical protein